MINATTIGSNALTGIERYALRISQEISQYSDNLIVAASAPIEVSAQVIYSSFLSINRHLLDTREYILRSIWDQTVFRRLVKAKYADVVYFPIPDGLLYSPVKQIVTVHDLHYLDFGSVIADCHNEICMIRRRLFRARFPFVLNQAAAIVTVSHHTRTELLRRYPLDPSLVHVIPNGYDETRFRGQCDLGTLNRYDLRNKKYFIFVGSILRHKNICRIIEAFARSHPGTELVIAGAGKDNEYKDEIKRTISSNQVDNRVKLLEYVPDEDLPHLYAGAIALALPSLHEGFGVPIIESMACGTPVITSTTSAMPEIANGAALLVDPYDTSAITDAMNILRENQDLRANLIEHGKKRSKEFSWASSGRRLLDLCQEVYMS
jgi:glycosyltransferase involved in cell wall biosynthesis